MALHPLSPAGVSVYSSHGKWSSPLTCGVFLPQPLLQAFLLLVAGHLPLLLPSPAGLFIYSSMRDFSSAPLQCSGHPALFAMCLFCFCLLFSCFYFFSFFPGWVLVCPGGYADQAQGCLWGTTCRLPGGLCLPKQSGSTGALLVSPFNVKWRCSAWTGSVEQSKFCLFSVFFPARCIPRISPRFYFRKHTFCFLPIVAILESPSLSFLQEENVLSFLALGFELRASSSLVR
jgi:hypothetical protein